MTPATVFPDVRVLINDTDSTAYRYTDAVLVAKLDDALKRIAMVRPDLFITIGTISCTAGSVEMTVPNYGRIVEVYDVVSSGVGIVESSREIFDKTAPGWRNDTPAAAINWMRHPRNPSLFFIYPPAPVGQQLRAEYTVSPSVATVNDTIPLAEMYLPAVKDLLVAVIEWGDDEFNLSQRAETFFKRAMQLLTANMQTNPTMDAEGAGEPPQVSLAV